MPTKKFFQVVMDQGFPKVIEASEETRTERLPDSDESSESSCVCPQCGAKLRLEVEE